MTLCRVFSCVVLFGLGASAVLEAADAADRAKVAAPLATRLAEKRQTVTGITTPLPSLSITDLAGRDLTEQVKPRSERGALTLDLAGRTPVVLKPREIATLPLKLPEKVVLPGGVILPSPDGTATNPVWFRLTLAPSPMPAPWDPLRRTYGTRLTFGLQRPPGAPASLTLDQPILIKLDYQGLDAAPAEVRIDAPGIEHEKTIELRFTALTSTPTLRVRSPLSDVNFELTALPRLDLLPERSRVLGFGLDRVEVAVRRVRADGTLLPVDRATSLALALDGRATIETPDPVFASGEAVATIAVRTAGLGPLAVTANADGVAGATTLYQQVPWAPVIAVLLGGALGGYARRFVKGARRAWTARRVSEGLVVAMIAFVAGVLGVGYLNLPPALVATEAGAFLTGALTAFVGVNVLESLGKKASAEPGT